MRVIAVDWSGAFVGGHKRIWLAEASQPGRLDELRSGRTRQSLTEHLLERLAAEPETVVGFDFAFSFPSWYLRQLGLDSARALWAHAARDGEAWLRDCAPPLWGRGRRPRPAFDGPPLRRTEQRVVDEHKISPKSVFQIGGAGSVGTGSIRGMPLLHALNEAGAHVWPFDPPGWPLIVEIYPRLLTGKVVKSRLADRQQYLTQRYPDLEFDASVSEDAFDAAVSALVMVEHASDFARLPAAPDPTTRLEGEIWIPSHSGDAR